MKLLFQYLSKYKLGVILAFLLAAINQSFSLMDPFFFGKLIDGFAKNPNQYSQSEFLKGSGLIILAIIGVAMVSRIAKTLQDYVMNSVIQKFGADVFIDGLKHTLKLPFQQFEDQRSGETLSILQKVRSDSEKFITVFINVAFTSIVGIVFVIIYAINLNPALVAVYFIGAFALGTLTNILSKKIKEIQKTIVKETTALAGTTTESLRNIELVKSLGLADQEINRLKLNTLKILKLELKKVRGVRSINFVQGTFVNLLRQIILFILLFLIFKNELTVGQLLTLQFYSFFIFGPLQELGNVILAYREAEASLNNFQKLLNTPVEMNPENPKPLGIVQKLTFENVSFKHSSAENHALEEVNFEVKKGETIAFVGPSGSGKTTLVKLLVGLYKPNEGKVFYNNIDSDQLNIDELRNQIGFVTQDTQLFSGTIRENLLFVNPTATDELMLDKMQKAACHNLLKRADNGLDTVIGEGGMKISGGEKQRLSIARALLRDPKIFVFDEATSALDSLTEQEITTTVREVTENGDYITVMIAHRLSTIMHADRIYVLEKGKIIEVGKHEDLLLEKGLYYAMWRQQIGERQDLRKQPAMA
ncbi:ABC transporter ATP-binding protein [Lacihabitans soyangensis]|uniref:ABC transporter ATP-binding protein n=1 Tax=Lacihabitans soyangensis TaxID=869394 RepID=A0AAE3H4Y6_9BACT|nr:ABC transporter ATP-binding protein [Lacihabitans soyangensis]MCP9764998.1 ABC transporter ATP-binding protein [Lacihabitans soyangensis]